MTAQSVILPLPSDHARFIVLRLKDLSIPELKEKIADLLSTRDRLITQYPHAQIKTAIAFGPELWAQIYTQAPEGFKPLAPIQGSFEMPVVIFFFAKLGLVDDKALKDFFRYAIVIIFVIAAILTPPDVLSQFLMAAPLTILYGISILVAKSVNPYIPPVDDESESPLEEDTEPKKED